MQTPGLEAGPADPGNRHLPELVRTRLDSWYPSRLAPRFQPSQRPRTRPFLRPLPLVLAALLLVLLAATALAGSPRALTDVIVNLAGSHPGATPTPRPHSAVAMGSGQVQPAPAANVTTPTLASPSPGDAGLLAAQNQRLASAARTSTPIRALSPDPLASVSPGLSTPEAAGGRPVNSGPTSPPADPRPPSPTPKPTP
jgi:hypothetical protein